VDAAIMLGFDDGRADFYTAAFPALTTAGIKSTLYAIPGLFGNAGYITSVQAGEIYAAGHDIGNHSNTHPAFDTLTQAQIEAELSTAKTTLDAAGMTRASDHVAYPYGTHDFNTMTATGMITGRVTTTGYMTLDNVHDNLNLYSLPIYYVKNTVDLGTVINWINNMALQNKIIYLLFHSIVDTPTDTYEWSTADFVALLAHINSMSLPALTITEWYARYTAKYP
jgi:peptidoglycan/xylan/chitin deacetylase (PgdA/CDA1 family)